MGLPPFLVGFVALMLAGSVGLLSPAVVATVSEVSRWCLVTAIAALGMKTSFGKVFRVGWRPVALMVAETAFLAVLVLVAVTAST